MLYNVYLVMFRLIMLTDLSTKASVLLSYCSGSLMSAEITSVMRRGMKTILDVLSKASTK